MFTVADSKNTVPDDVPFRILATLNARLSVCYTSVSGNQRSKLSETHVPIWHSGNIYELSRAPPNAVEVAHYPMRMSSDDVRRLCER